MAMVRFLSTNFEILFKLEWREFARPSVAGKHIFRQNTLKSSSFCGKLACMVAPIFRCVLWYTGSFSARNYRVPTYTVHVTQTIKCYVFARIPIPDDQLSYFLACSNNIDGSLSSHGSCDFFVSERMTSYLVLFWDELIKVCEVFLMVASCLSRPAVIVTLMCSCFIGKRSYTMSRGNGSKTPFEVSQ